MGFYTHAIDTDRLVAAGCKRAFEVGQAVSMARRNYEQIASTWMKAFTRKADFINLPGPNERTYLPKQLKAYMSG